MLKQKNGATRIVRKEGVTTISPVVPSSFGNSCPQLYINIAAIQPTIRHISHVKARNTVISLNNSIKPPRLKA